MDKAGKRTALTVLLMVAATMLSKLLGLFRDILLAGNYGGGSCESVAFEAASRIPTQFFDFIIGGVITAAFIPVFSEVLTKHGKGEAMRFANHYLNLVLLISLVMAALGAGLAPVLVNIIAPGLEGDVAELTVSLTRIMFPQVVFTALAFCYVGILQSLGEFNLPSIISLVSNAVVVLYYYTFNSRFGIYGLAVATVVGWAAQSIVQAPRAHFLGYRYSLSMSMSSPHIKRSAIMALPILVSMWMQPFCNLINTRYASGMQGGRAITAVGFATRLYTIIVGIFSFVATNLIFPKLSMKSAEGDNKEARKLAATSIKILLAVIVPISFGVFVLAQPFVEVLYLRGEFTVQDATLTATALSFFALGMPALAANEVLSKLFFSRKDVKPPMLISVITIALDFVLVYLLSSSMGISGIALSSSIAVSFSAVCHYCVLLSRGEKLFSKEDAFDFLKLFASSAVMTAIVYLIYSKLSWLGSLSVLLIAAISGAAVYAVILLAFPTKEIRTLKKAIFGGKND
jgi:putative peptidoglycan lipid II flippase